MKKPRPRVVRESAPVQVYLDRDTQARLDRLADHLDATKSDVLRRGLEALEQSLLDPAQHPALRLIGIGEERTPPPTDAARQHDQVLAEDEEASWRHDG